MVILNPTFLLLLVIPFVTFQSFRCVSKCFTGAYEIICFVSALRKVLFPSPCLVLVIVNSVHSYHGKEKLKIQVHFEELHSDALV